jgi:hypothetical protein
LDASEEGAHASIQSTQRIGLDPMSNEHLATIHLYPSHMNSKALPLPIYESEEPASFISTSAFIISAVAEVFLHTMTLSLLIACNGLVM